MNRNALGRRVGVVLVLVVCVACLGGQGVWGQSVLGESGEAIWRMPGGDLRGELDRLELPKPVGVVGNAVSTGDAGAGDLEAVLRARGLGEADRARVLKRYRAFRESMRRAKRWRADAWAGGVVEPERRGLMGLAVPEGLPLEFELYLRGALHWKKGEVGLARVAWRELLALPVEARRQRSVWAAYMLGVTHMRGLGERERARGVGPFGVREPARLTPEDEAAARLWFAETRRYSAAGLSDSLGLSAASLGQEARLALSAGDPVEAIRLYSQQYAAGDASAAVSLRVAVEAMMPSGFILMHGPDEGRARSNAVMRRAAEDAWVRQVVTVVLVTPTERGGGLGRMDSSAGLSWVGTVSHWSEGVNREDASMFEPAELSRLAWLAYRSGMKGTASRWLTWARLAEESGEVPPSVVVPWLEAKLTLGRGDLERVAGLVEQVMEALPLREAGRVRQGGGEWGGGGGVERFVARGTGRFEAG
ncbi:MAG: hypothetical protein AAF750_16740, partial [Planctomycetota bacterium]